MTNDIVFETLLDDIVDCINECEQKNTLPSPIMERKYSMLISYDYPERNEHINFMMKNYFLPKYGLKILQG